MFYSRLIAILVTGLMLVPPAVAGGDGSSDADCDVTFRSELVSNGTFGGRRRPPDGGGEDVLAGGVDTFVDRGDDTGACFFRFRAQRWRVIWIDWDEFHLQPPYATNGQCLDDYVEVIVTDYQDRQHISGRYCGSRRPPPLHTVQRLIDIRYHLSSTARRQNPRRSGTVSFFKAKFNFLDEAHVPGPPSTYADADRRWTGECGGAFWDGHGGVISNPGYPETYPAHVECNWLIRVARGKRVYIKLLELEIAPARAECDRASLYIVDGYKHVLLEERASSNGTVFVPDVSKLNNAASTAADNVETKSQVRFCGEESYYKDEGQKSYISQWNRILISFVTKTRPNNSTLKKRLDFGKPVGFRLVWTEISAVDRDAPCDAGQFFCRGGSYCLDRAGTVCTDTNRQRLCIHPSLVCDGLPNCAEGDDSDEENCYALPIIGAGATLFGLLVVVILVVILYQRQNARDYMAAMRRRFQDQQHKRTSGGGITDIANNINNSRYSNSNPTHPKSLNSASAALNRYHQEGDESEPSTAAKTVLKAMPQNYVGFDQDNNAELEPFISNHIDSAASGPHAPSSSASGGGTHPPVAAIHRRIPRSQRLEFHKDFEPTPYLFGADDYRSTPPNCRQAPSLSGASGGLTYLDPLPLPETEDVWQPDNRCQPPPRRTPVRPPLLHRRQQATTTPAVTELPLVEFHRPHHLSSPLRNEGGVEGRGGLDETNNNTPPPLWSRSMDAAPQNPRLSQLRSLDRSVDSPSPLPIASASSSFGPTYPSPPPTSRPRVTPSLVRAAPPVPPKPLFRNAAPAQPAAAVLRSPPQTDVDRQADALRQKATTSSPASSYQRPAVIAGGDVVGGGQSSSPNRTVATTTITPPPYQKAVRRFKTVGFADLPPPPDTAPHAAAAAEAVGSQQEAIPPTTTPNGPSWHPSKPAAV